MADRFDPLSAPMLRALSMVAEQAQASGCQATVCGEIGGRPLEAMALIGLGFRSLSMSRPLSARSRRCCWKCMPRSSGA